MDLVDKGSGFPKGVYQTFDIPFFYANLGQNAATRVQSCLPGKAASRAHPSESLTSSPSTPGRSFAFKAAAVADGWLRIASDS